LGGLAGSPIVFLLASRELYAPSYIVGLKFSDYTTENAVELASATYGSSRAFYGFTKAATDAFAYTSLWDHIIIVGTLQGKGMYTSISITPNATAPATSVLGAAASYSGYFLTDSTNCSSGICTVTAPTGGVAQFMGLE